MLNKIKNVLLYVLAAISIAGVIAFFVLRSNVSKRDVSIVNLQKELFACQNTLPHIDTIRDTVRISGSHVHPKPQPNDNQGVQKPSATTCNPTGVFYSETYSKEGVKLHWQASTMFKDDSCLIDYIEFPEILYPKEIITVTKTVVDTVEKEVPAKIKSKVFGYGGLWLNNFQEFPGIELGVGYLRKNNWFLQGGALYLNGNFYGTIKVGVTF